MAGDDYCKVYDAEDDGFTAFVQFLLALLAVGSLYIKRTVEIPRRKFYTWFLDVSKQGAGAVYAHFMNMATAAIISQNVRGHYELKDECAWYAINFFFDTTLGLLLSVVMLGYLTDKAKERGWDTLIHSGVYEGPEGMKIWFHQLASWIGIMTIVKIVLMGVLWILSPALAVMGDFLFRPLQENIKFELVFVMILLPGLLNIFYFCVADEYLKAGAEHTEVHEPEDQAYVMFSECDGQYGANTSPEKAKLPMDYSGPVTNSTVEMAKTTSTVNSVV